eukprot:TRINITY_DN1886_c0_g1_i2.p1 TRINITY_DN1886_c0_g1~~TRINITY_DN1886_c0_g1_i2.p1  ORF type:complete len:114 (+),score=29.55 TRINITY_DN1886_c0_g1_i2:97-438(+)
MNLLRRPICRIFSQQAPRMHGFQVIQRQSFAGGRSAVVAKWREMFKAADLDGSGFLEMNEVRKVITEKAKTLQGNEELSEQIVEECINKADRNKDGKIDLDEFVVLLQTAKSL